MEALFSSGVTALKLAYLISHTLLGGNCIGKSCGFKTWEKIHGGCYISSPGYVMTTEEKKELCSTTSSSGFWLLLYNQQGHNGRSLHFTHTFFLFLLRFSPVTEKGMFISLPCGIPIWVIALDPVPMNNHSLEEAELTATLITACSCFRYPSKKRGGGVFWQETKFSFFFWTSKNMSHILYGVSK